jgi:uncharacterized protein (DUF302 family)
VRITDSATGPEQTAQRLDQAIERRGLTVFARIDHAEGARQVGMELPPEQVVIFGNPRTGTPLMQSDGRIGIELPLRMLIWQHGERTLLGYDDPLELADRYDVPSHRTTLEEMSELMAELTTEAAG